MTEEQILEDARALTRARKYDEARRLLLTIPDNKTAQKWLWRLQGIGEVSAKSSNPYSVPSKYKPEQLRCTQCQHQLGKDVIQCDKRAYDLCLYEYERKIDIHGRQFFLQLIFGFLFAFIAFYYFVQAYFEQSVDSIVAFFCGSFFFLIGIGIFSTLLPRVIKLYNQETGERWQKSNAYGIAYRSTVYMPDWMKRPPSPQTYLAYPASAAVLYDAKIYPFWSSGVEDAGNERLAYVLLTSLLHLVSLGYLQILFFPTYTQRPLSKDLQRQPNNDFNIVLTDLGKSMDFSGKLEQKIKKLCKSSTQDPYMHNWVAGAPLMTLVSIFNSSATDTDSVTSEEKARLDRIAALKGLLKDAAKSKLVLKKRGRLQPNPELMHILQDEAIGLAELVEDFYELDPAFVKTLQKQIANLLGVQMQYDMVEWMFGRKIGNTQ